jgi:Zn-dependent peptidase ImmA (M78 family)/DNA-binding XRE family transcriptional regulator
MKGVSGFIAKRLTEAREARGLRKTNLAELVQVSDSQISKYESNSQTPSPAILDRICSVLAMPIEYFFYERPKNPDIESPIYYRSMSYATQQQRKAAEIKYLWLQDIYTYLWEFIDFPAVNLPDINPPNSPEKISDQDVEEAADYLRQFWGLSDGPIENLSRLVENNGIVLSFFDLGADGLDGFSQKNRDRPHIIISTGKTSAVRIRFSLAHELGHLILHTKINPKTLNDSNKFKQMEQQAHRFASAFIFPQSSFCREITIPDLVTFRMRKPRWKLSIAAMIFRAKNLGLIDDDREKVLRRSYGAKKWSRTEPLDDQIEVDYPELLRDAIELLINEGIKTRYEIINDLALPRQDIEKLLCLETDFLKDNVIKLNLKTDYSMRAVK